MFRFGQIFGKLLDFLFPPECLGCGREDFRVCPECANNLVPETKRLSTLEEHIGKLIVLADYDVPLIARSIKKLKFGYCKKIAGELKPFFEKALQDTGIPKSAVFCPIPLHFLRQNDRGFNQAELIAGVFGEVMGKPVKNLLKRVRNTSPQTTHGGEERRENLKNAFRIRAKQLAGIDRKTPLILIDDVATTLSTLKEAAITLETAGYRNLSAIVIARSG